MTYKELLVLAAKAAGIDGKYVWSGLAGGGCIETGDCPKNQGYWNPLTDDGDALRLAVKLHLDINIGDENSCASIPPHNAAIHESPVEKHNESDKYSATRRAIVRAAAEIGKAMGEAK